jgi:hypothetical protein
MTKNHGPAKSMWAYAYQIVPPQSETRLAAVKALLDREHTEAKRDARTWEGRFVHEQQITHILVVSDSPDQDGERNQRLESALAELQAAFVRTAPMAVTEPPAVIVKP